VLQRLTPPTPAPNPATASPPIQPLRRVGSAEDGGKIICDVSRLPTPCVIYSLGSRGDYSFEHEVGGGVGRHELGSLAACLVC
jgi:hypothetical protein